MSKWKELMRQREKERNRDWDHVFDSKDDDYIDDDFDEIEVVDLQHLGQKVGSPRTN